MILRNISMHFWNNYGKIKTPVWNGKGQGYQKKDSATKRQQLRLACQHSPIVDMYVS
jgi:hypothetical protein